MHPRRRAALALLVALPVACAGDLDCPGDSINDDGLGCVCPRDALGDRQELARDGAGELLLRNDAPFCRPLCDRVDGTERLPTLVGTDEAQTGTTGEFERDATGRPVCGVAGCADDLAESVLQLPEESDMGEYAWLCVPVSP